MEFELTSVCGYLLNQVLPTKVQIIADDLSKNASSSLVDLFCIFLLVVTYSVTGNSTILNQLEAGPINVRQIKSISVPS